MITPARRDAVLAATVNLQHHWSRHGPLFHRSHRRVITTLRRSTDA